eukprot:TRINITY_DN7743_c0_g1_i1.p1 TRINITY_DN7743_c0_g1~~TRINITY_DN7743_c0_g1_i1.p1  ORF type:complete len:124 (+),score=30.68 TRINITY_DN7743_c0_g1_i1:175-546(+)
MQWQRAQGSLVIKIEDMTIVPSQGTYHKPGSAFIDQLIALESFGTTLTEVKQEGKLLPEKDVNKLAHFFVRALRMMEQRGIFHGNLKPQNVLCNREFDLKLTDFGSYRPVSYTHLTLPTIYSV